MPSNDSGQLDLSRRKLLGSVATLGAAGALGGAGTMAFFSDEESYANNQLTAGSLDMKVAYDAYYSDWSPDEDGGDTATTDDDVSVRMWDGAPGTTGGPGDLESGETGLPTNAAWLIAVDDPDQFLTNTRYADQGSASCDGGTDAGDLDQPVVDLDDVKPGDFGEVTFDFALCDNPGYVWLRGGLRDAAENGLTEPESEDEDEESGTVELLDVVNVAIWTDDGNNYQNGQEAPAFVGSLRDVIVGDLGDASAPGVGLVGDIPAEEGGGTGRNCFSAGTAHSVAFAWWVPVDHGNEIQTDSATFDLGFYTEQCRHNDGMGNDGGGGGGGGIGDPDPPLVVDGTKAISWLAVCCGSDPGTLEDNIECVTLDENDEVDAVGLSGVGEGCDVYYKTGDGIFTAKDGSFEPAGPQSDENFCGAQGSGDTNDEDIGTKIESADIKALKQSENLPDCSD